MMTRDFSNESKQNLLNLVSEVENEKWSDFTDWVGDGWYCFESWIGLLNIRNYIGNINEYHKKVIDKNNTTKEQIEEIFADVQRVNGRYTSIFDGLLYTLDSWNQYIEGMTNVVNPSKGDFNEDKISTTLGELYDQTQKNNVENIKNNMKYDDGQGNIKYDMDVIAQYIKTPPEELTDSQKIALLGIISELSDENAKHTTVLSMGDEKAAAYIGYLAGYKNEKDAYMNFIAAGAYYNDAYIKVLNMIEESSKDKKSFAAQILNIGVNGADFGLLGIEGNAEVERLIKVLPISGTVELTGYIAKLKTENTELYAGKVTVTGEIKGSGNIKFSDQDIIEQTEKKSSVVYDPNTGTFRECGEDEYKKLKERAKLGGIEASTGISASILDGTLSGENDFAKGSISAKIGNASADASIGAGFYVYDNGIKAPSVDAHVGASVSAIEISAEGRVGNDDIGVYANGETKALSASAGADGKFTLFNKDGKLDVQANVGVSAEANLVEASGSAGVEVLGADIGVSGSVKIGVGAHADVGYVDGHLKVDVGAALGVGVSVGFDIDVGGLANGVATKVSDSWSDISAAASGFFNKVGSWLK